MAQTPQRLDAQIPDQPDLAPEQLISVMEAARRLGVDRSGLNRLIASGQLTATKIGRGYAVTWRAIQACSAIPTPTPQRAARRPRNRYTADKPPPGA